MSENSNEESFVDPEDSPGLEQLFGGLFNIADKYNFNVTNNIDKPSEGLYHIGDFCGDVLSAVKDSGYVFQRVIENYEELKELGCGVVIVDDNHEMFKIDEAAREAILAGELDGESYADNQLALPVRVIFDPSLKGSISS